MTNLLQGGYIFDKEDVKETLRLIYKHAIANYEYGWDNWIECLDDEDRIDILSTIDKEIADGSLKMAKCYPLAMLRAAQWVAISAESNSIGAENSALYDTGTQEGDDRYSQYTSNAKRTRDEVKTCKEKYHIWQKHVDYMNEEMYEKHYYDGLRDAHDDYHSHDDEE